MAAAGEKRSGGAAPSRNEAKRRKLCLNPGVRGLFVTAGSPGGAAKAGREVTSLLNRYIERVEGGAAAAAEPTATADAAAAAEENEEAAVVDVEAEVAAELAEEAAETDDFKKKRFYFIPDVTKGVSFVRFTRADDDPAEIVRGLLTAAKDRETARFSCRYASRLIPVEVTCKPHAEDFGTALRALLEAKFPESAVAKATAAEAAKAAQPSEEAATAAAPAAEGGGEAAAPLRWAVQYTVRQNMKTLQRDTVTALAGEMIGPECKVDLTGPDVVVLVEVNPLVAGAAVCRDYFALAKYNLYRLCHPEEEEDIAAGVNRSRVPPTRQKGKQEKAAPTAEKKEHELAPAVAAPAAPTVEAAPAAEAAPAVAAATGGN